MTHDDAAGRAAPPTVPSAPPAALPPAPPPGPARLTYRYLRVSVVAMALLLFVAIGLDVLTGGDRAGSISGYFYSPVRSVLVGALVAIGPALVAIKGRPGWEDVLLDLAGMVIPLVAFVPVPRELGEAVCGAGVQRCVPPDLVPAVVNNVTALIVLGVPVLAFAWWTGVRRADHGAFVGLVTATGAYLALVAWFWASRGTFLAGAHDLAAITFFLLTAAVAELNSRRVRLRAGARVLSPDHFAQAYRVIAGLMVATLVLTVTAWALETVGLLALPFGSVFAVEAVLLVAFIAFWLLQTAENWDVEATEA